MLFFSTVGNYNFSFWKNEFDFQIKESPKYLAIYTSKKMEGYISIFHVPNNELFPDLKKLGIRPTRGLIVFWYMLRSKYLFVDNNNFFNPNASFLIGNYNIIQCFHGTPLKNIKKKVGNESKKINILKKTEKSKYICYLSTCNHTTKVYEEVFNTDKVIETGFPRNDIFFNKDIFSIEGIDKQLDLEKYSKVFLYAPTFRKLEKSVNPFDNLFLQKLNMFLVSMNYIFLIKQHPYSKEIDNMEDYVNIIDISSINNDVQEVLLFTDILITDYSSLMFDFSLLDRPIILFPYDLKEYGQSQGFHMDYIEGLQLPIVNSREELLDLIMNINQLYSNESTSSLKAFKKKYNIHIDGRSCERVFSYLLGDSFNE